MRLHLSGKPAITRITVQPLAPCHMSEVTQNMRRRGASAVAMFVIAVNYSKTHPCAGFRVLHMPLLEDLGSEEKDAPKSSRSSVRRTQYPAQGRVFEA